ncbi:hypothetical protein EJ07DRAFT_125033, partial [Lizonia empirigonia]
KYHLHWALLIQHSDYFKKALNGPWTEAQEGVIHLDDVESGPFDIFVDWLYSKKVPLEDDYHNKPTGDDNRDMIELKAIVLGDRLLAPVFAKAVQRHFVDKHLANWATSSRMCKAPSFDVIVYAFQILEDGNPILALLVDQHVKDYTVNSSSNVLVKGRLPEDKLPHSFLARVAHRYAQGKRLNKTRLPACNYHGHANDDEKVVCART